MLVVLVFFPICCESTKTITAQFNLRKHITSVFPRLLRMLRLKVDWFTGRFSFSEAQCLSSVLSSKSILISLTFVSPVDNAGEMESCTYSALLTELLGTDEKQHI